MPLDQSIFDDAMRARALDVTESVAAAFLKHDPGAALGPSLSHGAAGLALLHAELEALFPGVGHRERAEQSINRALLALEDQPLDPSLFGGFVGIAWAFEHLGQQGAVGYDPTLSDPIDDALLDLLSCDPYPRTFDLVRGVAGIAVYALERSRAGRGEAILPAAVRALDRLSAEGTTGRAWPTLPDWVSESARRTRPRAYEDFGLAHGLAGLLPVLAAAAVAGAERALACDLLEAAVGRLLSRRVPGYGGVTCPAWEADWDGAPEPTRAAWCYGDPGVATGLWLAASVQAEPDWRAEALAMMGSVARRRESACSVFDACLCHGSAGLAHLLRRWHLATGDDALRAASVAWFERTLEFAEPGGAYAGFPMADFVDGSAVRVARIGLLDGTAGVALALASALSGREPAWDRAFLASIALPPSAAPAVDVLPAARR